jgi:hypothetical protein
MSTFYTTPDCLFSLQVKNKPNGGITFPAFILGAGTIRNSYCWNLIIYKYAFWNIQGFFINILLSYFLLFQTHT